MAHSAIHVDVVIQPLQKVMLQYRATLSDMDYLLGVLV